MKRPKRKNYRNKERPGPRLAKRQGEKTAERGEEKMPKRINLNRAERAEIKRNIEKGGGQLKYLVIYPGGTVRVLCWEKPDEKDFSAAGATCHEIKEYCRSKTGIPVGVIVS